MTSEGIAWKFFSQEAQKYNYAVKDINLDENEMKEALKNGPIIVSVKRVTLHYLVIFL